MRTKEEQRQISAVAKLTKRYKAAPGHLAFFAASPYILTYATGASLVHVGPFPGTRDPRTRMLLGGLSYCSVFTLMPALPVGTALTASLALTASALVLLSIPIAYPIAMAMDKLDSGTAIRNPNAF